VGGVASHWLRIKPQLKELAISVEPGATHTADGVPRLLLSETAMQEMRVHGYADTSRECGGVMVGQKLEGEHGPLVLVEAVIDGMHTDAQRGKRHLTPREPWERSTRKRTIKYPELRIVGWVPTHAPRLRDLPVGVRQFIQRNFFDLPWNVGPSCSTRRSR